MTRVGAKLIEIIAGYDVSTKIPAELVFHLDISLEADDEVSMELNGELALQLVIRDDISVENALKDMRIVCNNKNLSALLSGYSMTSELLYKRVKQEIVDGLSTSKYAMVASRFLTDAARHNLEMQLIHEGMKCFLLEGETFKSLLSDYKSRSSGTVAWLHRKKRLEELS